MYWLLMTNPMLSPVFIPASTGMRFPSDRFSVLTTLSVRVKFFQTIPWISCSAISKCRSAAVLNFMNGLRSIFQKSNVFFSPHMKIFPMHKKHCNSADSIIWFSPLPTVQLRFPFRKQSCKFKRKKRKNFTVNMETISANAKWIFLMCF